MKVKNQLLLLSIAALLSATACNTKPEKKEGPAPLVEMKSFFKNGDKTSFQISPDGNYYSYRADYKGKMNIFVQKVGDTSAIRITNDTLRSIFNYQWKGGRIVYSQDIGGDENFQLFSVMPDGSNLKALTPFPGYRSELLDDLRYIQGKENLVLVMINKRDKRYFDPYVVNVESGELTLLYENKDNYDTWYIDNSGMIRMATKTDGVNEIGRAHV